MSEPSESRVGVYIDFDNVVISRFDQLFGRGDFMRERARHADSDTIKDRLEQAKVDIGAILDYASSFGTIAISRAYADWSAPANAGYQRQLVNRAVDLAQLFQVTSGGKNGADIRLAVDVVEELYRLPDLTHVVLVAGDSDYIALAQSAKRLGRTVIGIGVAGATSRALMAACDEFTDYDEIPGVVPFVRPVAAVKSGAEKAGADKTGAEKGAADKGAADKGGADKAGADKTLVEKTPRRASRGGTKTAPVEPPTSGDSETPLVEPVETPSDTDADTDNDADTEPNAHLTQEAATDLLVRALRIAESRGDDDWVGNSQVKNQMLRMDPSFKEKSLGFKSFTDFVDSRSAEVEIKEGAPTNQPRLRLRDRG